MLQVCQCLRRPQKTSGLHTSERTPSERREFTSDPAMPRNDPAVRFIGLGLCQKDTGDLSPAPRCVIQRRNMYPCYKAQRELLKRKNT